jgi:hypothetical protein
MPQTSAPEAPEVDDLVPAVVPDESSGNLIVVPEHGMPDQQRSDAQAYEERVRKEMNNPVRPAEARGACPLRNRPWPPRRAHSREMGEDAGEGR